MTNPAGGIEIKPVLEYRPRMGRRQAALLFHYITFTLGQVKRLLKEWNTEAGLCIDTELRKQALSSLHNKDFHCQGGAVFAVPYQHAEPQLLSLIVAYQTLCDYLDNLCDRANCTDGEAFRQLHESLLDALTPGQNRHDYYELYPYRKDNGYIDKLVAQCQNSLKYLPSYHLVYEDVIKLARLYIDLQVHKHIALNQREYALQGWAEGHLHNYPGILWQEFAAASGSTLALFALFGLAGEKDAEPEDIRNTVRTYFPWICGLHILLDYFIDQEEDRQGGDLNFTFYYPDNNVTLSRLKFFIREAHQMAKESSQTEFAQTVVEGLLAMYLSDRKVKILGFEKMARELIKESGSGALNTYRLCRVVRKFL
ncbi:MAG: tetraprenyl-beta-curcumene synthase family protein [Syntrophomonas sp.]